MTRRISLPFSVLVLALVATLTLGTAGAATAQGLTAKAVKKIAAKVVDKKAAGLSVAKAKTADTATTATTATNATNATNAANATNATNAGNAAQLAGSAPATYLDRVSHVHYANSLELTSNGVSQLIPAQNIQVPQGVGYIHVTATAGLSGGGAQLRMWAELDGPCVQNDGGADYAHGSFGDTTQQTTIPVNFVAPVNAGGHNVRLCAFTSGAGVFTTSRSLTITTVAGDFNG